MGTYTSGSMDYSHGGMGYDYASSVDYDSSSIGISSTILNTAVKAAADERSYEIAGSFNYSTSISSTTAGPTVDPANQGQCHADYPSNMLIVTAVAAFVLAILGSFGNLLTIIALPMNRKLRTTATAFVVNLAVVELLFCLLILPMSGAQYIYLQKTGDSLLTDNDCIFFTVSRYGLTQVELQTILGIALTRALAISVPSLYNFLNKSSVISCYIAFIWIYSFAIKMPTATGNLGRYGFNECTMECDMIGNNNAKARFIMILIEAIIPVLVIFFLYIFLFIMVIRRACVRSRKFSKPMQLQPQVRKSSNSFEKASKRANKVASTSGNGASTSENEKERKGSNSSFKSLKDMVSRSSLRARLTHQSSSVSQRLCTNRRDMRVARTIFIIFLLVLICSVPVAMIHMVDKNVENPNQFLALHILYWAQYCLNLVVYVLMNRQYRDAYIECLARVFPRFRQHQGTRLPWEKASISSKPPQMNPPTSTRPRANSNDSNEGGVSQEPEPVITGQANPPLGVIGRLSTIPEANSSSIGNDSILCGGDPNKDKTDKHSLDNNKIYEEERCFDSESENEMDEAERKALMDKEHWVTANGSSGGSHSKDESKV